MLVGVPAMVLIAGSVYQQATKFSYSVHYKMIVEVETPDGIVYGSAVHRIGNSTPSIQMPDVGNPGDVQGEAVVVDLGERGVLFALISHHSDNLFYDAFPLPGRADGQGGSTEAGMRHHASLPLGAEGVLDPAEPPGYPKLVKFNDINDPKSVTLVQVWSRGKGGRYYLEEDRMEELFGEGVKLKSINMEITDAPLTNGKVEQYLPWLKDLASKDARLNGSTSASISTNDLADNLGSRSFSNLY